MERTDQSRPGEVGGSPRPESGREVVSAVDGEATPTGEQPTASADARRGAWTKRGAQHKRAHRHRLLQGRPARLLAIFLTVAALLAAAGVWYWLATRGYESTDDAFIAADTVRVAPQVSGRVARVDAEDNRLVRAGDLLVQIDSSDIQARLDQARAALTLATAQLSASRVQLSLQDANTKAAVDQANADLEAAQATVEQERAALAAARAEAERANAEWARYEGLDTRVVAATQRDIARTAAETAQAQVTAAMRRVSAAEANTTAARSRVAAAQANRGQVDAARADVQRREAEVAQAEAALREAELALSYTTVKAPIDGRVTRRAVEAGDYVQTGQALMVLVPLDVYVEANFKETQLRRMRPGQRVRIHVDAYRADFDGRVDSFQAGAGAAFSLLPPENATGNYVKVVQRVPVKIVFDERPDPERYQLGPGMSVVPRVNVR